MHLSALILFPSFVLSVSAQVLASDPGIYGPALELVHVYFDEFPTGIAVSSTGRMFSNYPSGLDSNNTKYAVAELTSNSTETPYPSVEINSPPGGSINYTTVPASGANYQQYLVGVQSVVIDPADRLWILDTGRASTPNGTLVLATYGGPKLIGVNLTTNSVFQTIVFPSTVAYPDSYLNDVRFDLRINTTSSGQGVAYITDSSNEGRNGLVVVDLGTGESWRHLNNIPQVHAEFQNIPYVWGEVVYQIPGPGLPIGYNSFGADGIALSADGDTLYWSPTGGRYLYSIPTLRLLDNSVFSEIMAQASVVSHGQKGISDGLETDTNGFIYGANVEQESIVLFNPANGTFNTFVRDPRIGWTDTMSVATDGYLYFTENQLWRLPSFYPGTDRRVRPFALFRAALPNNGSKVILT
ncbi:hypothetical protein MMC13_002978 [Lambiella insularis]|nr:hypothetical protein [Lambiella insularis]